MPKKKADFFNGGRGINFSEYEMEEDSNSSERPISMDEETSRESHTSGIHSGEISPLYSNSPVDPHSSALSWNEYAGPSSSTQYDSQSPQYLPTPRFPAAPFPTYLPPSFGQLEPHSQPSAFSLNMPHRHFHAQSVLHSHTHATAPIVNPIPASSAFSTPPTIFPEPSYGPFMASAGYSSLRPMEPHGSIGVGYSDFPQGAEAPVGLGGERTGEMKKKKRQQKCSLCSNHNISVDVKGHKWFCPYRNCPCERCTITRGRQHHMKEQQKLTRHLQRLQWSLERLEFN